MMNPGRMSGRTRELEEQFFLERDKELLQALRQATAAKERKEALAEASGITDEALLDQLVKMEVCSETVAALSLVPLVAVAWADNAMADKERAAVLDAAAGQGLEKGHPGYQMLESWLKKKPAATLLTVWKGYVAALVESLDDAGKNTLKNDLLGRARGVAEAAGGLLGLSSKVSKPEQAMLDELEQAFG